MTKILILSDIHNKVLTAQKVIDRVSHDKCILLGDYFDSYGDTPEDARKTAIWLKECVLHNPKIVPLMGNHCTSYIFDNNIHFRCSGYTPYKSIAINDVLNVEDKSKFHAYHIDQNHVFSHAGLTNKLWKKYSSLFVEQGETETKLEFFDRVMKVISNEAIEAAISNNNVELFGAGWDREGFQQYGGMNWVDWRNLAPINGINQIVGHSTNTIPQILMQKEGGALSKKDVIEHYKLQANIEKYKLISKQPVSANIIEPKYLSVSYNLDTNSNHYMVIEDGVENIYDLQTHINLKELGNYYIPDNQMNTLS
jgi:hypothetical protein